MLLHICRTKIHGCILTDKQLEYGGSIGLPKELTDASGLYPNERVQVLNLSNGTRLETYVIVEENQVGKVTLYGPAARLGEVGDKLIVLAYAWMNEEEAKAHTLVTCTVDEHNRPLS